MCARDAPALVGARDVFGVIYGVHSRVWFFHVVLPRHIAMALAALHGAISQLVAAAIVLLFISLSHVII